MKLTQEELQNLIKEELTTHNSVLLEMPYPPIVGKDQEESDSEDPSEHEGERAKQSLFHMSQQAQQLHDMLQGDENLEPWVLKEITKAATSLEKAFKAVTYDKGPGQGRL